LVVTRFLVMVALYGAPVPDQLYDGVEVFNGLPPLFAADEGLAL